MKGHCARGIISLPALINQVKDNLVLPWTASPYSFVRFGTQNIIALKYKYSIDSMNAPSPPKFYPNFTGKSSLPYLLMFVIDAHLHSLKLFPLSSLQT